MIVDRLVYQDQSADGLRLSIIDGSISYSQFRVVRSGECLFHGIRVSGGIIGASHALTYECGSARLNEVLACVDVETQDRLTYYSHLNDLGSDIEVESHGLRYRFKSVSESLSSGKSMLENMLEQARSSNGLGMVYEFPHRSAEHSPMTIVLAQPSESDTSVIVRTAHSYPNNDTVVFTQSDIIKLSGK